MSSLYIVSVLTMFPNIGNKSKKKAVLGTPEMVQEWAQTKK